MNLDTIVSTALDVLPAIVSAPEGPGGWAALVVAVHAVAVAVVNLTPTPKDDQWLRKGYRVIEFAAGIVSRKAKE